MRGLLDFGNDQPQGLLAGLQQAATSPLTLTGLGLLSGGGWDGAMRGAQVGMAFDERRRRDAAERQERDAFRGLLETPDVRSNLPQGFGDILLAAGPDRGFPLLTKYADPDRPIGVEMQKAQLAKTRAETEKLSREDPMTAFVMQMLGGVQPGGSPVDIPASPQMLPQSAPLQQPDGQPRLQEASNASTGPQRLGVENGVITTERIANPQPPQTSNVPDWYRAAQFIPTQAAPQQPTPGAQPQRPTEDLVQTPRGLIPREEARRIGNALLFHPQFSAIGKEFLDAARATSAPELARPAVNALQEKQMNTAEAYARLRGIEDSWKPEYQTIESRLGFKWNSMLDKFSSTRQSVTPEQRQELAAFHANKAESLNNLNLYIKEITGAQMSIQEAARIRRSMPDPGEGVFDGDGPIEFEAKLKSNIRMAKMSLARFNYFMKRGLPADVEQMAKEMPLDDMPGFIQQRTNAIKKDILDANPGLETNEIVPLVRQRLRAEFGIDA